VTKARSNATANAAKGDLTVGNGTNLSGVLGVGSNGDTIVADSSTSTGLRYQAPVNANPVLNSAFQIWQRGTASTSIATSGTFFLADRWQAVRGGYAAGGSVSRQATNDTTNLPNIQYCARVQRDSGNTSTASINLGQNFESVNAIPYAGKQVTFSFYARAGANYSTASSNLGVQLYTGTGTDQNGLTGAYTGSTAAINTNAVITTTWQRFSFTATLSSSLTELYLNFTSAPVGTAGAADYFEVTGVQLEVGSVATPFKTNGATIQGELAACQRYYQKSYNQATVAGTVTSDNTEARMSVNRTDRFALDYSVSLPVTMRTAATVTLYSPATGASGNVRDTGTGADKAATALNIGDTRYQVSLNSGVTTNANSGHTWQWVASAEL
jgi:hypothetical protein